MKIETKFNPDQKVFFLKDSKLFEKEIHSINTESKPNNTSVIYWFNLSTDEKTDFKSVSESMIFESKQEFLDQLEKTT